MGYECPVCGTPQADAGHLANHLAITAIARGGDHESWLDEHVPGWGDLDEGTLADRVTDFAGEAEFPQVFEDTTGASREDRHPTDGIDAAELSELQTADGESIDVDSIVEQARNLTEARRSDSETE